MLHVYEALTLPSPLLGPTRLSNCTFIRDETEAEYVALTAHAKMDISNKGEDQNAMDDRKYIHWKDEGVEKIPSNEAEDIQAVADMINSMQKAQYNQHRHCYTGMADPIRAGNRD